MRYPIIILGLFFLLSFKVSNYEKKGDKYFKVYNYERALREYSRAYKKDQNNTDLLLKIVSCYMKGNELREQAIPYLEKLEELKPFDHKVLFFMAKAHYHAHHFEKAQEYLEKYKLKMSDRPSEKNEVQQLEKYLSNARNYVSDPVFVELINVGEQINTSRSELNPFVTRDESVLFYSSDKKFSSYGGIYYFNVCVSEMDNDAWMKAKTIGSTINTQFDEIVAGINPTGEEVFVFHNRYGDEATAYSRYKGNYKFDLLSDFGYPIDLKGGEYGVCMTTSGDTLIYSAEAENGATDLYYAIKLPSGEWGKSRPLPGKINSEFDENFPVFMPQENRIYFSSNNLSSMGGYDLFYASLDTVDGTWGEPVNLGYPINDTYDNFSISWVQGKRIAYVSAIRPEGFGNRDIYKVVYVAQEPSYLIYRCALKMQTDSGLVKPWFNPQINVFDTLELKVGTYSMTVDSARFILALPPGDYVLRIEDPLIESIADTISISEKWYPAVAREKEYILFPKQDEIPVEEK